MNEGAFDWKDFYDSMDNIFSKNTIYQTDKDIIDKDIDVDQTLNNNNDLKNDFNLVENYLRKQLEDIMNREHSESIMFPEYKKVIDRLDELENENEDLKNRIENLEYKIDDLQHKLEY